MDAISPLETVTKTAVTEFVRLLGRQPRWVVAAPGRVNLIGEHTDYNDGFVMPMAIDRHVVIAADYPAKASQASTAGLTRLYSVAYNQWATVGGQTPLQPGPIPWARYVEGVIAGWMAQGFTCPPFEAVIASDVPQGGGLSSSAAIEVASATLLEAMTGVRLEPMRKVLLCQKAEHDFAGVPCGIMDQSISIMGQEGKLLLLDCRTHTGRMVSLADPSVEALIINSNVKHALTDGGYAARRRQCEESAQLLGVPALRDVTVGQLETAKDRLEGVLYRRARHVVTEIARTVEAAEALERGDWPTVGRLMYASHASLRDDYQVSCEELDLLVELAAEAGKDGGVIGSRMTGGGFGGCNISLVRQDKLAKVAQHIKEGYQRKTGREATVFVTRPADGARILQGM